jgi:Domain of unknown function (DUF3854)
MNRVLTPTTLCGRARALELLLSDTDAEATLHPHHLSDLRKSGLTDETIALQNIRTVPRHMMDQLLGFRPPTVEHAYLIPFFDVRRTLMPHIRMKVFPTIKTTTGTIKYLQPRASGVRIYFPLATLQAVVAGTADLYVCEGEKKSAFLAQLGLATVGLAGIEGWHARGDRSNLHPDLNDVALGRRAVHLVPDGDWRTNPNVYRAVERMAEALERRGARVQIVDLRRTA